MKTIKTILILTVLMSFQNVIQAQKLRNKLVKSITQIEKSYPSIQEDRKIVLDQLASRILKGGKNDETITAVFIDKHNTEKSQLAAIWLKTGLLYYGVNGYQVLSAGTEISPGPLTALPALETYGFRVNKARGNELYAYIVKSGEESWPVQYKDVESLNLVDGAVMIFVDQGTAPEGGSKQIEITLSSPDTIALEMLYVSSRIDDLTKKQQL